MPRISEHKQRINVPSPQLEINQRSNRGSSSPLSEDFTGKLQEAQTQLEILQQQQAEVERQKIELQELNESKEDFLQGQIELSEKLSTAITAMDREIFAIQQEMEELQQTRTCFADHLEKIDLLNPDGPNNEALRQELSKAISILDLAEDEYEQAVAHFATGRNSSIFGVGAPKIKRITSPTIDSELMTHLKNGFAFNLPLLVLGIIGLIIFMLK